MKALIFIILNCLAINVFATTAPTTSKPVVLGTGTMKTKIPTLSGKRTVALDWLVHRVHTRTQCTQAGGVAFEVAPFGFICQFNAGACPSGWSAYSVDAASPTYKATSAKTCTGTNLAGCTGTASPANCTVPAKSFNALAFSDYSCSYKKKAPSTIGGGVDTGIGGSGE